jgi:tetratricopeptide (TPR) repeat protein
MNGQLSNQPLAELIREISLKCLGGRLRLEHDRVKIVAYFENGNFRYAAANMRTLRLREYLRKSNLVSDQDLTQFNDRVSDTDLIKVLCAQKLLSATAAEQMQLRQVADVLRLALMWTEGDWEFDSRSRLGEQRDLKIDVDSLLLETGRRLPAKFAASRFQNPVEVITPIAGTLAHESLLPAEGFLLSRLDAPMALRELVAISGAGEEETLRLVYSLALAGLLKRDNWKSAFDGEQTAAPAPPVEDVPASAPADTPVTRESREIDLEEVENFLARVKNAQTYYDVLGISGEVSSESLKAVYYEIARRYHPDRFRRNDPALVARIESAFARITQAYDTLRDDGLRASYNLKIAARRKTERLAETAPKPAAPAPKAEPVAEGVAQPVISAAERAEVQFKEGFAALEQGQRRVAIGLFASAASAVPNEPRYRAFYGHMLAGHESTRRAAETELHAAIKLDPKNAEYRVMLAELYRDLGLKLRAKGEAERAVAADPNNRKARDLLRGLK